jgi:hypothetical protein
LKDTIIDWMTDILVSKSDTNSERHVAGFDSQFKMINEHPQSYDPRFNREFYHYDRVRTYAHRKLHGWSPMTIDCMIFPNNVGKQHWNHIIVYPKERHIVGLDSMHVNSCADARTIFRWLSDQTSYNHPGDVDKLFQPRLKGGTTLGQKDRPFSPVFAQKKAKKTRNSELRHCVGRIADTKQEIIFRWIPPPKLAPPLV